MSDPEIGEHIQKLDDRFAELNLTLAVFMAEAKEDREQTLKTFARISDFAREMKTIVIKGNGTPGLITRIDRVERGQKQVLAIWGLLVLGTFKILLDWIKGGTP